MPLLEAHLVLSKQSIDDQQGPVAARQENMQQILPLLAMQAKSDGLDDLSRHLDRAIACLESPKVTCKEDNIVDFNLERPQQRKSVGSA